MFQFFRDFDRDVTGARKLEVGRALNPEMQTFDLWLAKHKPRTPLE